MVPGREKGRKVGFCSLVTLEGSQSKTQQGYLPGIVGKFHCHSWVGRVSLGKPRMLKGVTVNGNIVAIGNKRKIKTLCCL